MNRHITLMLENGTKEDLNKIKNWCKENKIEFAYRYSRDNGGNRQFEMEAKPAPLYYFTIFTDTAHYYDLSNIMGEKLLTTDFADFSNQIDCDDTFENRWKEFLSLTDKNRNSENKANRMLLNMIMPIKNASVLRAMLPYQGFMTDSQKKMIDDRIKIIDGKMEEIQEQFTDDIMSIHTDVKELRARTGMSRREFCRYFKIPYRTVEDWETKKSTCATYLYKLMEEKLKNNGKI